MWTTSSASRVSAACGLCVAMMTIVAAPAAAGHGAASYENQLKQEQKKRKSEAPPPARPAQPATSEPAVTVTGDRDRDFATAMRRRCADDVAMAEDQVKNGTDPQLKAFAQRALEDNRRDLADLDRWLSEHPQPRAGH